MENEFITYEQALALKELGFDKPCLGYWNIDPYLPKPTFNLVKPFDHEWCVPCPLYQQVFRWFRDEHNILVNIYPYKNDILVNVYPYKNGWLYKIYDIEDGNYDGVFTSFREDGNYDGVFTSFREAEIACLEYLIGFVDFYSYL